MKDLKIVSTGNGKVKVTAQTKKAKKVFVESGMGEYDNFESEETAVCKLLSWAISHDLSTDSEVPAVIPKSPHS
jgi:hypothetical protein